MPRGNYTIQRCCKECGKIFTPPTINVLLSYLFQKRIQEDKRTQHIKHKMT